MLNVYYHIFYYSKRIYKHLRLILDFEMYLKLNTTVLRHQTVRLDEEPNVVEHHEIEAENETPEPKNGSKEEALKIESPFVSETNASLEEKIEEGEEATPGYVICHLKGKSQAIISAERTALNFLQTLSGTATQTKHLLDMIKHTNAKLLDTRKTIPNLRYAQKYAVKCGGGVNHRMGLFDCVLLKENHILSIGSLEKSIEKALLKFPNKPVIVEVESLDQLKRAVSIKGITNFLNGTVTFIPSIFPFLISEITFFKSFLFICFLS